MARMFALIAVCLVVAAQAQYNFIDSDVDHPSGDGRKYLAAGSDCDLANAECLPQLTCEGFSRVEEGNDVFITLGICTGCSVPNVASVGCASEGIEGGCEALLINGVCGTCVPDAPYGFFTEEIASATNVAGIWCPTACDACTTGQTCDINYDTLAVTCVDPPTPAPTPAPTPTPTVAENLCVDNCNDKNTAFVADGVECFCDAQCNEFGDCCPTRNEDCAAAEPEQEAGLCGALGAAMTSFCPASERLWYTPAWVIDIGGRGCQSPEPSTRQPSDNRCIPGSVGSDSRGSYLSFACTRFGTVVAKQCTRRGCDPDDCDANYSQFYADQITAGHCFDNGMGDAWFFVCDVPSAPLLP